LVINIKIYMKNAAKTAGGNILGIKAQLDSEKKA